jgi:hypothetical protein
MDISTTVNGVDFKGGMVNLSNIYVFVTTGQSFILYFFTTASPNPSFGDDRATYDNASRSYTLSELEYPNGFQLKFSLAESSMTFVNDRLECAFAIGLNVTPFGFQINPDAEINYPLRNDWSPSMSIIPATPAEASRYDLYGTYSVNQAIEISNLTQFYIVKIDLTRNLNLKNVIYWIPPVFMLVLALASMLLIHEDDLSNTLIVTLAIAVFSFGYLVTLNSVTPPALTSIEILTIADVSLSFFLSIIAIILKFRHDLQKGLTKSKGLRRDILD